MKIHTEFKNCLFFSLKKLY